MVLFLSVRQLYGPKSLKWHWQNLPYLSIHTNTKYTIHWIDIFKAGIRYLKKKNVGGVKKENMWPFGLGSLMFFKVTQAQFGKNLDENLAKNELENLHKRNLSRFKFSIFIPVSPPVRKKILVLLPLLLFLPGPSFKFNQLKFITRTDLPQQNIWAIEQTLIGIRKMT